MNESCVSHFMALADATVVSLQQSNTNASCHVSCHTSERVTSHTSESVVLLTLSLWQTQQLILCNSRTRMRHATHHVTHLNESRHTHLNQSCRSHYRCARRNSFFSATVAYEWVMSHIMSHIWMSHVTHIWISRVAHIIAVADATVVSLQQSNTNASCHTSCHTSERVMSHTSWLLQTQRLFLCNSRVKWGVYGATTYLRGTALCCGYLADLKVFFFLEYPPLCEVKWEIYGADNLFTWNRIVLQLSETYEAVRLLCVAACRSVL